MRALPLILLSLALLAGPAFAETPAATPAEAVAAFRKALEEGAKDENVKLDTRKAMLRLATTLPGVSPTGGPLTDLSAFGKSYKSILGPQGLHLTAEAVREWLTIQGQDWPAPARESATALANVLERETTARLEKVTGLAQELIDAILQAGDDKALEAPLEKARALLGDRSNPAFSEGTQEAMQVLMKAQRLAEGWQVVLAARAAGKPGEAVRRLGNLSQEERELPLEMGRKLVEKRRAVAVTLGVLPPDEADKEIRKLVAQVLAAPSAKEVDPLIQELQARRELWGSARELGAGDAGEVAGRAARFAGTWQDYLAAKAAGAVERARSALGTLSNTEMNVPGVPRSMLLERSMELSAPDAGRVAAGAVGASRFDQILANCKTLADLEGKVRELEAAYRPGPSNGFGPGLGISVANPGRVLDDLRALDRDYQDAKVATQPQVTAERNSTELAAVRELRRQLVVFTLSRQFGAPSVENDTPAAFLRRRLDAARGAKDWRVTQRVLDAAGTVGVRNQLCLPSDGAALTHYLAGVNFEDSGVARFAVASYMAALNTGSDFIPLDDIRVRLGKLRTKQAADYAEGLKLAATGGLPTSPVEKDLRGDNKPAATPPNRPPGFPSAR